MSFLLRVLVVILASIGIWALLSNRRSQQKHDEAGEDVGRGPDTTLLAAPEAVELRDDIPDGPATEKWKDFSDRRKLPPDEYRASADEPETNPEPSR